MNPALHTNCGTLATISPCVVTETLGMEIYTSLCYYYLVCMCVCADIAIEIFDKCRKNRNVSPLTSMQHFRKLN